MTEQQRPKIDVASSLLNEPTPDPLAAQKTLLAEAQLGNSEILTQFGIAERAVNVARLKLLSKWKPGFGEITPVTRFVIIRGSTLDYLHHVEHLGVAKFEGEEEQWTVDVGERNLMVSGALKPALGFGHDDVKVISELVDELDELKRSGELSELCYDLDAIH
jgi:hypothetical protein